MNVLADSADRRRALTVLDQTLLVEAAAGTGKTSLLAGRVTMLLASGVGHAISPPSRSPSSRPENCACAWSGLSTSC